MMGIPTDLGNSFLVRAFSLSLLWPYSLQADEVAVTIDVIVADLVSVARTVALRMN